MKTRARNPGVACHLASAFWRGLTFENTVSFRSEVRARAKHRAKIVSSPEEAFRWKLKMVKAAANRKPVTRVSLKCLEE